MDYMHSVKTLLKRMAISPAPSVHGSNDDPFPPSPITIRVSDDLDDVFDDGLDTSWPRGRNLSETALIPPNSDYETKGLHLNGNTSEPRTSCSIHGHRLSANTLTVHRSYEPEGHRLSDSTLKPQTHETQKHRLSDSTLKPHTNYETQGRRVSGDTVMPQMRYKTQGIRLSGNTTLQHTGYESQERAFRGNSLMPYPGEGTYGCKSIGNTKIISTLNQNGRGNTLNCNPLMQYQCQESAGANSSGNGSSFIYTEAQERTLSGPAKLTHPGLGLLKRPVSVTRSMPSTPTITTDETQDRQRRDLKMKIDVLNAELMAMKKNDQELAKKFLNIYSEIRIIKVQNSCMNYSDLLEEAFYEAEVADAFPDMCDLPRTSMNRLLLNRGVTRMNISARRFSCS